MTRKDIRIRQAEIQVELYRLASAEGALKIQMLELENSSISLNRELAELALEEELIPPPPPTRGAHGGD